MTTDESLAEDADLIYQDLSDWKNQFFAEVREDKPIINILPKKRNS